MTELAIWAAIISAFAWFMNAWLDHPRLGELADTFNKWAALFALISALALLISKYWKEWSEIKRAEQEIKRKSFKRVVSGDPTTVDEWKQLDIITKPEKDNTQK